MPEDYIKILENVTVQDTIDLMQKEWDLSKLNLIIQGPIENTKENIEKYEKMISSLK